jgi:Uma2 family endonuclease
VSSKSTKNYDRGDKFDYYRSLPSLQEYILVEQSRFQVLQHTKTNSNQWLLTEYDRMELELTLGIMPLSITLAKIYEDIDFSLSS